VRLVFATQYFLKAEHEGVSINRAIKKILEEAFSVKKNGSNNKEEFMDLFKTWTQNEQIEFEKATRDLRKVNVEDWQ
jgi:hypothetical protein